MITLTNEDQLLDKKYRLSVIENIQSDHNHERKREKLKAYEIYKDMTKKWVVESISREFAKETVDQMVARASNISIARKINDKQAKCYAGGAIREIKEEAENTVKLGQLTEFLSFDALMKKADRFSQMLKNVEVQTLYQNDSVEELEDGDAKKTLVNRIMLPHQYDPIVHAHDKTRPVAMVLSDFYDSSALITSDLFSDYTGTRDAAMPHDDKAIGLQTKGEKKKPAIYIWWSGKYHFTTDDKGNILAQLSGDGLNPIGVFPFTSVHADQDDCYWSEGGSDVVDGSILVNVLITDLFSIMNVQGWGQMVVTGKKIPSSITGGPHKALTFEFDTGDPVPSVQYVSSNPPIAEWRECITMYVALMLSTNNLSTSNLSTKLEGKSLSTGIAIMLDNAESSESIEDKQKMFQQAEAEIWKKNFATQNYLIENGVAVDSLNEIGPIETQKRVTVRFNQTRPIMSETEKVEILKGKKESGLFTIAELLQIKNPDLKMEEAEAEAVKLLADRMKYAALYQAAVTKTVENMNEDLKNEDDPSASGASGDEEANT